MSQATGHQQSRREGLQDWLRFIRGETHILRERPWLLFQQSANQPDSTTPAQTAHNRFQAGLEKRPWLRWINKPQSHDPRLMTITAAATGLAYDPRSSAKSCRFSPDVHYVAAACADEGLKIWATDTGLEVRAFSEAEQCSVCDFSPDGNRIALASGGTGRGDGVLSVWSLERGTLLWRVAAHPGTEYTEITECRYSPNGRLIATACADKTVKLWDSATGVLVHTLAHDGQVNSCVWSHDSKHIASGSSDGGLRIWDVETGAPVGEVKFDTYDDVITSCAYSPDDRMIALGFLRKIQILNVEAHVVERTLEGHTGWVLSCCYSRDGRRILSGGADGTLRIWEASSGMLLASARGGGSIDDCEFSTDGRRILSCSDAAIRIWEGDLGGQQAASDAHEGRVSACVFAPDGHRFITASRTQIKAWNAATGQCLESTEKLPDSINALSYSPDGRRVAVVVGDYNGNLQVRDGTTLDLKCEMTEQVEIIRVDPAVWFSPDGRFVAGNGACAEAYVWDAVTGTLNARFPGAPRGKFPIDVRDLCYSPDGHLVAYVSEKLLRVWSVRTREEVALFGEHQDELIEGAVELIHACGFSPDGRRIVTAGWNGIAVWDLREGLKLLAPGYDARTTVCRFSPDGRRIISAAADDTVRVWDAESGHLLVTFVSANGFSAVAFADDGRTMVVGDAVGTVHLLGFEGLELGTPITTAVRLFQFDTERWEQEVSAKCPWCCKRFEPEPRLVDSIGALTANLPSDDSPCLRLEAEAWDRPFLKTVCPCCEKPVQYNPFFALSAIDVLVDSRKAKGADSVPYKRADARQAAEVNLQYQQAMARWQSLPRWKRLFARKPDSPVGN
jgi:WD40 repeat protein